jgi:pyrimidine-specific ribonucleoside hydrolase
MDEVCVLKQTKMNPETTIDLLFDMETGDPDDVMTLCFLISHPLIHLRAVTVTPGTDEQIGLVRHVLNTCGHAPIPVGSFRPGHDKNCVSRFHYDWIGNFASSPPDDEGYRIMEDTLRRYPDLTLLTGAPLKNFTFLDPTIRIRRWVAQGGFAGDNIVPPQHRLPKFEGMLTCPTYNFNGAPQVALRLLASPNIELRQLISKNVCHGMVYDQDFHARMHPYRHASAGLALVYEGMEKYLNKSPDGKKFHDPLAACVVIDPSIVEFREVEMYRHKGKWGAELRSGTHTWISVSADRDRFIRVFSGN